MTAQQWERWVIDISQPDLAYWQQFITLIKTKPSIVCRYFCLVHKKAHLVVLSVTKHSDFCTVYIFYFALGGSNCCDECVCLSVCLPARLYWKPRSRTAARFFRMLTVAAARSPSDGAAILCVLPVLWMASYLHKMDSVARHVYS